MEWLDITESLLLVTLWDPHEVAGINIGVIINVFLFNFAVDNHRSIFYLFGTFLMESEFERIVWSVIFSGNMIIKL